MGPYAFIMPAEEIQAIKDSMQRTIDGVEGSVEGEEDER